MAALYQFFIALFSIFIGIAALFSYKAKVWIDGRRDWKKQLSDAFSRKDKICWFHAASLGEFEQGKPVIEAFRKTYPEYRILLTFFSPSGYEQKKNYKGVDKVMYLPADCKRNAVFFVRNLNPSLAVFIKYEFWYNYLDQLNKHNVPVVFISSLFRKNQFFFQWYGGWFRKRLKNIDHFFVQNENSASLLKNSGIHQVTVSGDTRFDRVADILNTKREDPGVKAFCEGSRVIIAGSTWPPDETILSGLAGKFPELKLIIAPHEVNEERVRQIIKTLGVPAARYTEAGRDSRTGKNVLIIDTIGILSAIYQYADIAYIGGAFATGLHNIQEPAVNGIPVIFGPKYQKFREAADLVEKGGAYSVGSSSELQDIVRSLLSDQKKYQLACKVSKQYMLANTGATTKIMEKLATLL
ncbi:MAG: glycosyltransferase N-terminal domain-containing protein [Bacteroidales bacterium]|nr:glycosyltransferase N-terminal domain-containing protein [Bacteroidales bacterium]